MNEPKYKLYSQALCVSGREELAAIDGLEVSIIGCCYQPDRGLVYTVTHESKSPQSFECLERELQPVRHRANIVGEDRYAVLRSILRRYLHQEFDVQFDSVADAVHAAIRQSDKSEVARAIEQLEYEADSVVADVLGDHEVAIWDVTTPRELLVTIKTLVKLS